MPHKSIPNTQKLFISGSRPSLFREVSNEETLNLLVVDGLLVPTHGLELIYTFDDPVDGAYKSDQTNKWYVVAGSGLYEVDQEAVVNRIGTLDKSLGNISFAENINDQISITTGNALYVYNTTTGNLTEVTASEGLQINSPNSCTNIDQFILVSERNGTAFQISDANNALSYQNFILRFTANAGNIVSLSEIDNTLFVIGNSAIERWVTTPNGTEIFNKDNVYLEPYGLVDQKSFVNKFNMSVGWFKSKSGSLRTMVLTSGSEGFRTISEPGITKKMQQYGNIVNSDIYEIDENIYYELVFENRSFIYNFTNQTWTESSQPREQVVSLDAGDFAASSDSFYKITLYSNNRQKRRQTHFILRQDFGRFNASSIRFWFNNANHEIGIVNLYGTMDNIKNITINHRNVDGRLVYDSVKYDIYPTSYQFSFILETYMNVIWRGMYGEMNVE